jgi:hypothetical protein
LTGKAPYKSAANLASSIRAPARRARLDPVTAAEHKVDGTQLGSHEREAIKWPIGMAICEADPVRAVALRVLLALVWPDARSVLPLGVLDRDVRPDRTTRA